MKTSREPARLLFAEARFPELFESPIDSVEPFELVSPSDNGGAHGRLRRQVARFYLRCLFVLCDDVVALLVDDKARSSMMTVFSAFQTLPLDTIEDAAIRPEIVSWIWAAVEGVRAGDARSLDRIAPWLSTHLFPFLLKHDALSVGDELLLLPSSSAALHLFPFRARIRAPAPLGRVLLAKREKNSYHFRSGDDTEFWIPDGAICGYGGADLESGAVIEPMLTVSPEGPVLCPHDDWCTEMLPTQSDDPPDILWADLAGESLADFCAKLTEGIGLVRQFWAEAYQEIKISISLIVPLRGAGFAPNNYSVHAFRGLIATTARPSYFSAQMFCHEAGHSKFSSILDLFKLFEGGEETVHYSPFVRQVRPLANLFHGVFSFLQDLQMSRRLIGRVDEAGGPSIARYATNIGLRIEQALQIIRADARLTEQGQRLFEEFERSFREASSYSASGNSGVLPPALA